MSKQKNEKLYTLKEACELLSISTATGRNWIKSGRLCAVSGSDSTPVFTKKELLSLQNSLWKGNLPELKTRRNKSYISGTQTCHAYISKQSENHAALHKLLVLLEENTITPDSSLLLFVLRHCAEQLIFAAGYQHPGMFTELLNSLLPYEEYLTLQKKYPALCDISYTYYPTEDTLGFLYLSLHRLSERKNSGSYYTPANLADSLITEHLPMLDATKTVLDPSCGTGIFLLRLPAELPLCNLYGNDRNPLSIAIARINLALKYHISTPEELKLLQTHFTTADFLCTDTTTGQNKTFLMTRTYDIILGNPPWGAKLSSQEKLSCKKLFSCAAGNSVESSSLFVEQSLRLLSPKGVLSFVLPESLLTVNAHLPLRRLLLFNTSVLSVAYLGEVFEQVHCPSIILTLTTDTACPFFQNVPITRSDKNIFWAKTERTFSADAFSFALTDEEYLLLQKLFACPKHTTLKNQADFALGIVTGNNTALLQNYAAPGLEPVIKGTDISKYHIHTPSAYINFQPEQFQQTAPTAFYRAPEKLFYRFINKRLMFAYDNTGCLSLNSCNIVIPRIPGLSVKYVLAILNSSVAQFIFEKKYHSVKVLRSHLEQLPIPLADSCTQGNMEQLVEKLMESADTSSEYQDTYALLDKTIASLFSLTEAEYQLLTKA